MIASSQKTVCEVPSFAAVPTHADPTTYMICISTRSTSPSSLRSPALLASTSATRSTASCLGKVGKTYSPAEWLETVGLSLFLVDIRRWSSRRYAHALHQHLPSRVSGDWIRSHRRDDLEHRTDMQPDHEEIARPESALVPVKGCVVVAERLLRDGDRHWWHGFLCGTFDELIAQSACLRGFSLKRRDHRQVGANERTATHCPRSFLQVRAGRSQIAARRVDRHRAKTSSLPGRWVLLENTVRESDRALELTSQIILRQRPDLSREANGIRMQGGFRHCQRVIAPSPREVEVSGKHERVRIVGLNR